MQARGQYATADYQSPNPIINDGYSADPSAHVFGDTLWVYPSHDRDDARSFSMEDYHAYYTTDMRQWHDAGVIFNPIRQTTWAKGEAWAPDCVERNGKYYLYYPTDKRHIGVAVGDSPRGPFHDPLGHPLISIDTEGVVCDRDFIDPAVFIDEDGQSKYAVMNLNYFEKLDSYRQLSEKNGPVFNTQVKIFSGGSPMEDLSYDEYEKIRNQLLEIFDKSFRPKNDKLN